jgi:hypothetical protein
VGPLRRNVAFGHAHGSVLASAADHRVHPEETKKHGSSASDRLSTHPEGNPMRALMILLALVLAACTGHALPEAKGPVFQLNPDKWTASAADLRVPAPVQP